MFDSTSDLIPNLTSNLLSDIYSNYNKIKSINNYNKYPFNLIDNINNILITWKEVELEYINDYKIFKDTNSIDNNQIKKIGSNEKNIINNSNNKIFIFSLD